MQSQDIHYLLDRYTRGQLTEEEERELAKLLQDPEQGPFIQEELVRLLEQQEVQGSEEDERLSTRLDSDAWEPVLQRVLSVDKTAGEAVEDGGGSLRARYYVLRRLSVAASILLVIGGGALFFFHLGAHRPVASAVASIPRQKITPGTNKAVLTLANGQQIMLNDAQKGTLGLQGNTKVIKLDTGALQYTAQAAGAPAESGVLGPMYNTIATPRGGQYQVVLADGTKVWLNAETSLRFPTAFTGRDRVVELTGEAYFEVAANKDKPFIVRAAGTETRVLGTHFNIMAYADEGAVKTTLLEGAVSMGQGGQRALLQPGEQGQFEPDKGIIARREVNTRAVVAWKDGYYYFDRTPVQSVMRQIARWYDVQIVYKGSAPKDEIVGRIPRSADVTEVLHIMELIGIRFNIDGKTIIVNS
ncbi:MAG TPA: FecR domain-containing protein [Puia sp.]|nr:FecR domain-containing protein [Puia sp.]